MYQSFFAQQLGVFSKDILSSEIVENFLKQIPSKYKLIEINLNTYNNISDDKYSIEKRLTHELDMIRSYGDIYKNYSQNIKRNIKKAEKSGLQTVNHIKPDAMIDLFRDNKGKKLKTLIENDYLVLKKIVNACLSRGMVQIRGSYTLKNELCAAAAFIYSNRKLIFLFSATNNEARNNGAMSYLINGFIKDN